MSKSYGEASDASEAASGQSHEDEHDDKTWYDNIAGLGGLDGFDLLGVASPERPMHGLSFHSSKTNHFQ